MSQSTIKMEKGYYATGGNLSSEVPTESQSTIKMEKGYYIIKKLVDEVFGMPVAIHNKNGKGLLLNTRNIAYCE